MCLENDKRYWPNKRFFSRIYFYHVVGRGFGSLAEKTVTIFAGVFPMMTIGRRGYGTIAILL